MSTSRVEPGGHRSRGIPEATVARLPVYHRVLAGLRERGTRVVSSDQLAADAGVSPAMLRKDLSHLGSYGTRGVGYDVDYLAFQIARELGVTHDWAVVIVGIGNLGQALANYARVVDRGFRVVGLIDDDPDLVGRQVQGCPVRPLADLEDAVSAEHAAIGVITTPAAQAQPVCDRLVAAGVTSILNFAPVALRVPDGVDVRSVDLAMELQVLAFHEQRKATAHQAVAG